MQTLNQAVKKDVWYNDLLLEYVKYEEAYCRIRNALSQANQDILEEYISLCQELEYWRGCIAVELVMKKNAESSGEML